VDRELDMEYLALVKLVHLMQISHGDPITTKRQDEIMNRYERRRHASLERKHKIVSIEPATLDGFRWHQRADPSNPNYLLIEMRLPNGGMPPAKFTGAEARDRLVQWAASITAQAAAAMEGSKSVE